MVLIASTSAVRRTNSLQDEYDSKSAATFNFWSSSSLTRTLIEILFDCFIPPPPSRAIVAQSTSFVNAIGHKTGAKSINYIAIFMSHVTDCLQNWAFTNRSYSGRSRAN